MSFTGADTKPVSSPDRTLLTADEVAAILRVTPRTVRRWTRAGLIEPIRLGGRLVRYTPAAVDRLISHKTSEAPDCDGDLAKLGDGAADDGKAY